MVERFGFHREMNLLPLKNPSTLNIIQKFALVIQIRKCGRMTSLLRLLQVGYHDFSEEMKLSGIGTLCVLQTV